MSKKDIKAVDSFLANLIETMIRAEDDNLLVAEQLKGDKDAEVQRFKLAVDANILRMGVTYLRELQNELQNKVDAIEIPSKHRKQILVARIGELGRDQIHALIERGFVVIEAKNIDSVRLVRES